MSAFSDSGFSSGHLSLDEIARARRCLVAMVCEFEGPSSLDDFGVLLLDEMVRRFKFSVQNMSHMGIRVAATELAATVDLLLWLDWRESQGAQETADDLPSAVPDQDTSAGGVST